ncbi:hypothetical protein [Ferruginibacter sp.]|uniref:hypothetical protein n=1 Tax=Ferruginibacter sp. TaxID=1940288 RepID=UPI0026588296|nr:hypothetical protein [Ferruginibacter sp.]
MDDCRINNPDSLLPVFKNNWIDNVNVISGNTGVTALHLHKVVPVKGTLRVEAENYLTRLVLKRKCAAKMIWM